MEELELKQVQTKKEYAELFLSELCDYFNRKKYDYKVAYRSWVDTPDVAVKYDHNKHTTYCDLGIFLLVEGKRINLFINFKVGLYMYKIDYRLKTLLIETKNGVRRRDSDYTVALKTTKEDSHAIYCFVIKNSIKDAEENRYKTRIISCNIKSKSTSIGAAIRNIIDDKK